MEESPVQPAVWNEQSHFGLYYLHPLKGDNQFSDGRDRAKSRPLLIVRRPRLPHGRQGHSEPIPHQRVPHLRRQLPGLRVLCAPRTNREPHNRHVHEGEGREYSRDARALAGFIDGVAAQMDPSVMPIVRNTNAASVTGIASYRSPAGHQLAGSCNLRSSAWKRASERRGSYTALAPI